MRGEAAPSAGDEVPTRQAIEAAFEHTDHEVLLNRLSAVQQAEQELQAIESLVTGHVGAARATNFNSLGSLLRKIGETLQEQVKRLGIQREPEPVDEAPKEVDESSSDSPSPAQSDGAAQPQPSSHEIVSREDVIRAIDRICLYYDRYEPSSPVPLLLRRAQRLASMSFLDIVRELTPEALSKAQSIGGFMMEGISERPNDSDA